MAMSYYKAGILGPEAAGLIMPAGYGVKKERSSINTFWWMAAGFGAIAIFRFDPLLILGTFAITALVAHYPLIFIPLVGVGIVGWKLLAKYGGKPLTGAAKAAVEAAEAAAIAA